MTKLTDAIKAKDSATALRLIEQAVQRRRYASRFYNPDAILTTPETLPGGLYFKKPYGNVYQEYKAPYRTGYDPLQLAAINGMVEVIQALLKAGVPLHRGVPEDHTMLDFFAIRHLTPPLNLALEVGQNAAALLLIDRGADVQRRSLTDLEYLGVRYDTFASGRHSKDVGLVYAASPMYLAAGKCSLEVLRALRARGAVVTNGLRYAHAFMDINNDPTTNYDPDKYGSTLIHAVAVRDDSHQDASSDSDADVISYLIENGVERDNFILHSWRENDSLHGPIHGVYHNPVSIALRAHKNAIASLLIGAGCSIFPVGFKPHHWHIELTDLCGADWANRICDDVVARAKLIAVTLGIIMRGDPEAPLRISHSIAGVEFTPTFTAAIVASTSIVAAPQLTAIQQELAKLKAVCNAGFLPSMICSISGEVMIDPVMISGGNSYDRAGITRWLVNNNTDPLSGQMLRHKEMEPNIALRGAILDRIAELLRAQEEQALRLQVG